jgi:hypothetical protein
MLPFTSEQFLAVFLKYNNTIWPAQIAAYLLGCIAVSCLFPRTRIKLDRLIAGVLAVIWLWTGLVYHGLFFSSINSAAYLFAALFVAQGSYLVYAGVLHHQIRFRLRAGMASSVGGAFAIYAMLAYPLIGLATGHHYPDIPMFGVTPCPATIFTWGMFLFTTSPVPKGLLVIPFIWSLVGGSAAILLHIPQDWVLLASGLIAAAVMAFSDRQATSTSRLLQYTHPVDD